MTEKMMRREVADPQEFTDVISPERIQDDLRRVSEIQAKILAETPKKERPEKLLIEKLATATEALVYRQIAISGWLSSGDVKAYAEKTSVPDDMLRGSDIVLVLEFDADGSAEPLAISVDLTIGISQIGDKIHGNKQSIDKGELASVRYHTQPDGTHKELTQIPRVAVFVSPESAINLTKLWVQKEEQRLNKHPIQLAIARQVDLQLAGYEEYARNNNRPDQADTYKRARAMIAVVLSEKEKEFKNAPRDITEDTMRQLRGALTSRLQNPSSRKLTEAEERDYRKRADIARKYR